MIGKEIYGKIIGVNLRHNFLMPFASALGVLILTLIMFNVTALQSREAARPIEFLLCFIGVTLLVPISCRSRMRISEMLFVQRKSIISIY